MSVQLDTAKIAEAVRGCWLGKVIGGTLGAPFEGQQRTHEIDFYVQKDLADHPVPNDDLDLQLVWMTMVENYGIDHMDLRAFGEIWLSFITGPWNEYAVCRHNCRAGFFPPLSGAVDNDRWKWSNGAWIRSEIWACLFPGRPDRAIEFAYRDACCDHCGEGIYAEMFTAALESAAFVETDLRKLIEFGLTAIPADSRVARTVKLVCKAFDDGADWKTAREMVVKDNEDLGFFQAPGNLGFMVIGLLYGGDDFGKTLCIAVNCGDDTDCTAATAGSIWGIIHGASAIPEKWTTPIGNQIATVSFNPFYLPVPPPKTVTELNRRVLRLQKIVAETEARPELGAFEIPDNWREMPNAKEIWERSPYRLSFQYSSGQIEIEYLDGPWLEPGKPCRLRLRANAIVGAADEYRFSWILPEGWSSSAPTVGCQTFFLRKAAAPDTDIIPPETLDQLNYYVQLKVRLVGREYYTIVTVPFRVKDRIIMIPPKVVTDADAVRVYTRAEAWAAKE